HKILHILMFITSFGEQNITYKCCSNFLIHLCIALMNDLFREIFAILFMYMIGWRYPRSAISSAGATAMDVTLPMVKQACGNDYIPHAMVSGFVLSVLAPIAVSVLAAL
ncbi:LysO family transporter, partial [Acinetobacter sp. ULE_I064]|uniref:LysO family transporter n=1 Tax=Acinetobacter sp. ULE_I064 TaxID=3373071 RepID=UPI003AF56C04